MARVQYVVQQFDEVEINDLRFENTSDKSWNQHILEEFGCQLLFHREFLNSKTDNTVELLIQELEQNLGHNVNRVLIGKQLKYGFCKKLLRYKWTSDQLTTFVLTWLVCCVTSQKVRKKVFNWSEVHLYRSNFLQNPYFNLQRTFGRISSHFLYFLFQIRRGCSVRNFRQTTRGMRNFQLLIDGATFLLMLLFSNNFKWNHNYRSMQFAKYTNYFMGKLASNLLWQYIFP